MIIFRLFSLLILAASAFSAGGELPHFEGDVRVLNYVHSDGRVFEAQRLNPKSLSHYAAAQILDPASQSDPQPSASSLLPNFSQWWRDQGRLEQAKLIESIGSACPSSWPLSQYILFLDGDLVGTFGLGIPDGLGKEMNLKGMKAMEKASRKDKNLSDPALEGINEPNDGDDIEKTNLFPYHTVMTRYVLQQYRGKGIGFVMSSMIHQLIDSTSGKSMLVPHFNEEDEKFSTVWTTVPLMGCRSDISVSNIASLVSHLRFPNDANAPEDVEIFTEDNGNIKLIYPKTSGASEEEMRSLKARIQAAKKEYKRSNSKLVSSSEDTPLTN